MEYVYLLLGSNIGDRNKFLDEAIKKIKGKGIDVAAVSQKYRTEPWGKKDQNEFFNMAVQLKTDLSPWKLMTIFRSIEEELGKNIKERWGERTIDIDIIFYGKKYIYEKKLIIPHPRFHLRRFVLIPLCDISDDFIDPVSEKRIKELLAVLDDNNNVSLFKIEDNIDES